MKKLSTLFVFIISIASITLFSLISCSPTEYKTEYYLDISISPEGAGIVTPASGKYEAYTKVILTAEPAYGYIFDHWGGDALNWRNSSIIITMSGDWNLIAYFKQASQSEPIPNINNSPANIPENISPDTPSVQTPNIDTGANTNQNQCPYIVSLTPENFKVPQDAPAGTMSSKVTCSAYDPDGDQIIYTWETNEGKVEGDGRNVIWLVPARPGNYTLKVTISDGVDCEDTGSIINNVYSARISGNTCYSKGSVKIDPRAENDMNNIPGLQGMPGLGQSTNPMAERFITGYDYENTITTTYK